MQIESNLDKMAHTTDHQAWYVLVCNLPLNEDSFLLGSSLKIIKLKNTISIFDLAAAGGAGFKEWATLEPFASIATAEIESKLEGAKLTGYDPLNKSWLVSALLILLGFQRHICPAVSSYSWNLIAGHQAQTSHVFKRQLSEEGPERAVFQSRRGLPPFKGGLLDYHLNLVGSGANENKIFEKENAEWISERFEKFNDLASKDERFRFALEAAVDWRYSKDKKIAIARLWSGIESLFKINTELVFRISLFTSSILAPRGPQRLLLFNQIKKLYDTRSKAVHGEPVSEEKLIQAVSDSFDVLRGLLIDAITIGRLREVEEINSEILCK